MKGVITYYFAIKYQNKASQKAYRISMPSNLRY